MIIQDPQVWVSTMMALAALITAITGLVSAMRGHRTINKEVKPEIEQVRELVNSNGHTDDKETPA